MEVQPGGNGCRWRLHDASTRLRYEVGPENAEIRPDLAIGNGWAMEVDSGNRIGFESDLTGMGVAQGAGWAQEDCLTGVPARTEVLSHKFESMMMRMCKLIIDSGNTI